MEHTTAELVGRVWQRLTRYGYAPALITAREALRLTRIAVADAEAFRLAWDERAGYGLQAQTNQTKGPE
jgi:hypothetical protein